MSPKPYIAKKAILLLYKVFLKNPDALRAAFPRLRKKLEDPDPGSVFPHFLSPFYFSQRHSISCRECDM